MKEGTITNVIRNVILDWSGTLVDDLPAVWHASNFVFRQAGIAELTLEQFRAEFCLPFTDFYNRFAPHVSMAQLETWFHAHFKEAQMAVTELPHARDFLLFCRERKLRTFLLSTVHRSQFTLQTASNGFDQFLERHYIEVWDKRAKIREMLAENNLAPEETIFVGDMQHDIDTARHGGIYSCAVLTGYNGLAQLRAAKPDLIVAHLGELRELLERNLEQAESSENESASQFRAGERRGSPLSASPAHPVITVGALIFDSQDRVLMIRTQKWSNLWGIPGGKIKFGERSLDALHREIKEETALEIGEIEFVLAQDCIHSPEFYRDAHFVLLNYTCRCTGDPAVRLNDEAVEFRWVTLDEAGKLALNGPTRTLLDNVRAKRSTNG